LFDGGSHASPAGRANSATNRAHRIKEEAKKLRPGKERQEMLRKARQADIAASITQWISSPGVEPPE